MKTCIKCGALFDGLACKVCANSHKAKAYAENPEKVKARVRVWRKDNPEKCKVNRDRWKKENTEKVSASRKKWAEANPENVKSRKKKWDEENPEKNKARYARWHEKHIEEEKERKAKYRASHPESDRIHKQNRMARKLKNGGVLSKGLAGKLFKLQKGKCPCCGEPLGDNYHLDHMMPLALGGANEDWNIQLLRQKCNNQKWTKNPVDFMQSRGFLL